MLFRSVVIAGDQATAEQIAKIRSNLGLDLPIHVQFFTWIGQLLKGDLGISIFTNMPVSTLIAQRLEPTLMLSLTTICFSVLVAVPLGVWAAWRSGTWTDRMIMVFSVLGFSFPVFVLGYLLIYQFGLTLKWLPTQGYKSPFVDPVGFMRSIILPTITLSMIYIALVTRITRASVLELAKAVELPNDREILHVLTQEFSVDDMGGINDPRGMTGIRLDARVLLFVCALTLVAAVATLLHHATDALSLSF